MKALINIASLIAVAAMLTGCSCWNSCSTPCEPKCCPTPHIWENNCCDQPSGY
ncbi:MAG: hypothetical protein J0H93_07110 [Chlamydiales bacterium]|nr:hypothetical protein [Chlamydiales bacterium]